ncbi:MAG: peptidylprolyl isomerase [Blastocatellia bacterium]|nr:peptidylprolyl isomerase [Blastocatellia bacterium]
MTGCKSNPNQAVAVLETDYGKIVFEFYPDAAPKHTERIQQLIRSDFYNGTAFHRVEPNSLIQGGDPNTIRGDEKTWGLGQRDQPRIQAEFSKLRHVRGIVSAARVGNDVNSATSQFFICCSDHPEWDNQYSIFGRVIVGMNVVDIISQAPTVEGTTRPKDKIKINRAYLDLRSNYPATPVSK